MIEMDGGVKQGWKHAFLRCIPKRRHPATRTVSTTNPLTSASLSARLNAIRQFEQIHPGLISFRPCPSVVHPDVRVAEMRSTMLSKSWVLLGRFVHLQSLIYSLLTDIGQIYHKRCLKCENCGKRLDPGGLVEHDTLVYPLFFPFTYKTQLKSRY